MNQIKLPAKIDTLRTALPHRPPMIWVDEVVTGSREGGICRVIPKSDGLYRDENGNFLKYAGIEWIAQAFGYSRAVWELQRNPDVSEPAKAFLVGIRTTMMAKIPADCGNLLIETKLFRELTPLVLVDGIVRLEETGAEFVKVQLKLFFE